MMEMQVKDKLEMELCDVLKDYAQKGIKSASDVETVKHALSGISKLKIIEEMDKYNEEHSHRSYRSYDDGGSYRRGYSHAMGQYDGEGGSYRRGRSHDGYEGGRSGHGMRERLEQMMEEARSDRERMAIQEALQKM